MGELNLGGTNLLPESALAAIPQESRLELNAALDDQIEKMEKIRLQQLREQEDRLNAERDAQLKLARRETVSQVIKAHLDGIPAEGSLNFKAREKLQDLRMSALTGTDESKDGPWHLERASEIVRNLTEERRKAGGDGSQVLPSLGLSDQATRADGERVARYSFDRLMLSLHKEISEKGASFDLEQFSGSPEAEMTKDILKNPQASMQLASLQRHAKPNQRIIPVPAAVLRDDLNLAETRAEAVNPAAAVREPTYRRDLLTGFFRPMPRASFLGVMMETISNDITISRITGAPNAAWVAENAASTDQNLVVATGRTSPKRLTAHDDISWMRLAAADQQFGVIPIVTDELIRAANQRKEGALYTGAVTNGPTGLLGTTGVLAGVIGGNTGNTAPTLVELLRMVTDIADGNIPVEMLRWATTWLAGARLNAILNFDRSGSAFAVPLYQSAGPGEAGRIGAGYGTIVNYPAALTTQIPTNLNSGAESNNDEHGIIAGVWPYILMVDYSTIFITIDDVSLASTGQTRITMNCYADIFVRVPQAFSYGEFRPFN